MASVVLGVAGGIAAYKACDIVRRLAERGHDVRVVPTASALEFVGRATWEALSGHEVATGVFHRTWEVSHVAWGQQADLVLVAPTTADVLSRAATGRADDLLTSTLLTATCPVVMAPAMHTEMWQHPATRANVELLRSRGTVVLSPGVGRLTGPDSGPGRLRDPHELVDVADAVLQQPGIGSAIASQDMAGRRVLVGLGGTREAVDPVRFMGNASSGRMGAALARAAQLRGAEVSVVAGQIEVDLPGAVSSVRVTSTADMHAAMVELAADADVVIMAAAPADWAPIEPSVHKISKSGDSTLRLEFTPTVDILADVVRRRGLSQVIVGFAAETAVNRADLVQRGTDKLRRKGCDLLVCNDVSGGAVFGSQDTSVILVDASGEVGSSQGSKESVAHTIVDHVAQREIDDAVHE